MLSLNLISKELKKEIKIKHFYKLVNKTCFIFVFTTIFIGIIFLSAKFTISKNYIDINKQINLAPINSNDYNARIENVNEKLEIILNIQNEFIPYSELLNDISNEITEKISLNYLKIDGEKKTVRLKGIANNRNNLLELKDKLKNIHILSNIELPLTNILEKENINFEINAKLNLNNLQK